MKRYLTPDFGDPNPLVENLVTRAFYSRKMGFFIKNESKRSKSTGSLRVGSGPRSLIQDIASLYNISSGTRTHSQGTWSYDPSIVKKWTFSLKMIVKGRSQQVSYEWVRVPEVRCKISLQSKFTTIGDQVTYSGTGSIWPFTVKLFNNKTHQKLKKGYYREREGFL